MLEVRDISKRFKSVTALDRVSLRFPEKGLVAILGESGSGKSTLFHVLTGAVKPDGGAVIYNGEKLNTDGKVNGKGIFGIIFQEGNLLKGLTVSDNLSICQSDVRRQQDVLASLGIDKYSRSKTGKISGGEMQRVAIARALLDECEILLADEPTGSLDEKNGRKVMDVLKEISREKLVLLITHNTEFADEYADSIVRLKGGRVISGGEDGIAADGVDDTTAAISGSNIPSKGKKARTLPAMFSIKYCAAKLGHGVAKNLTSIIIFAVIFAMIMLPLSLIAADCTGDYLDKISDYKYSALFNDRNVLQFEKKIEGADMSGLRKFYPIVGSQISGFMTDDSIKDGEVRLGAASARRYNGDRLYPLKIGDSVELFGESFEVAGFLQEITSERSSLDINAAVYMNTGEIERLLRKDLKEELERNHGIYIDVESDDKLAEGECEINYRLYYLLGINDEEFIDLDKDILDVRFDELSDGGIFVTVYENDLKIVGVRGNAPDESESSVLYVNSSEREKMAAAYDYLYVFETTDSKIVDYWLDRGVRIYSAYFDEYNNAVTSRETMLPFAWALAAVGAVLGVLYTLVVFDHIMLINRREIYMLKSLRVGNGSLIGILLLQFLPLLIGSIVLDCAIGVIAYYIVKKYVPLLLLNVIAGTVAAFAFALAAALIFAVAKTFYLERKFDVNLTR